MASKYMGAKMLKKQNVKMQEKAKQKGEDKVRHIAN